MPVVYATEGRKADLEAILETPDHWLVRLFKNDFGGNVPLDSVWADFTECDFSGYIAVDPVGFNAVVINAANNAETVFDLCQFTHDGGGTDNDVYGWVLLRTGPSEVIVVAAEQWADGPRIMAAGSDPIRITPSKTQGSC